MKFKHRLYMEVTEKQFRSDLEYQLKQLGYKNDIQRLFQDEKEILLTSVKTNVFRTTTLNYWNKPPKDVIKIEGYHPGLFLAIAAMTKGEDWIVGEYLMTKIYHDSDMNDIFKCKELEGADYDIGRAGLDYKHLYRKATLEELYKHFNYSKPKETNKKVEKKDDLLPDKKLEESWLEIIKKSGFDNSSDNHFRSMWEKTVPKRSFFHAIYPKTPDECYSKTSTKIERPKEILIKLRKSKKNKLKF